MLLSGRLIESKVEEEVIDGGDFYLVWNERTGYRNKVSKKVFEDPDPSDFFQLVVRNRNFNTIFAYLNGIGDDYKAMKRAQDAVRGAEKGRGKNADARKELLLARLNFIKHTSQYEMGREFQMVVRDGDSDVIVYGDFRLSNHEVSPSEWTKEVNRHHNFGISIVFNNNPMGKGTVGSSIGRFEVWEYYLNSRYADNVMELYNRLFRGDGKPITKEECDRIIGVTGEVITDGNGVIDTEKNVSRITKPNDAKTKKTSTPKLELSEDDIVNSLVYINVTYKNFPNVTFDVFLYNGQYYAYTTREDKDGKTRGLVYPVKLSRDSNDPKNGSLVTTLKFEIQTPENGEQVAESLIRGIVHDAIMEEIGRRRRMVVEARVRNIVRQCVESIVRRY